MIYISRYVHVFEEIVWFQSPNMTFKAKIQGRCKDPRVTLGLEQPRWEHHKSILDWHNMTFLH